MGRHRWSVAALLLAVALTGCTDDAEGRRVSALQVKAGQCLVPPATPRAELGKVTVVDCTQEHTQEAFALVTYVAPPTVADPDVYPGGETLKKFADGACAQQYEEYVGVPYADSSLFLTYLLPSARGWQQARDRTVTCFVTTTGEKLTRSVRDSKI